jgi:DNA replication protein DnaC
VLYENTKIAVKEITGDGERKPTEAFSALQSHYLFAARFGRPGKGNDKGNVEGLVGYARRNFMVPVPRARSWEELNAGLLEQCRKRREQKLWGHQETIGERFERDRAKLLPLPVAGYEACDKRTTRASSQALVRYETNDYSVPVEYGHRHVLVKAFVWEVVIACASGVIARHARSYGREEMIFDPLHYLRLLEQKTNALDQGRAARGLAVTRGIQRTAPADGSSTGQARAAGVCAGASADGDVFDGGGRRRRRSGDRDASHRLRCGEASGAVRDRAAAAEAGSAAELSASAAGSGRAHAGSRLSGAARTGSTLMDTPQVLLEHYLKQLRLPTIVREYPKLAEQCAKEGTTFETFLLRLVEQEIVDRERRAAERRIRAAKFPVTKSLDTYDFLAIPSLNKKLVVELARCEWIGRRDNVLVLGNSGTGKTHIGLALGLAACQRGFRVRFTTAAALVHELIEARDEKRLLRYQKHLARQGLLIVDELGFVPLSKTGAEMLFEVFSQRYERNSTLVTSNLPFAEWTEVFGSERLTGALLNRLTHHVHILEMNGDSFRLKTSRKKKDQSAS